MQLKYNSRRAIGVLTGLAALLPLVSLSTSQASPAVYHAGAATRSIAPTQAMIDAGEITLGGAGNGRVMDELSDPGLSVRAFAISPSADPADAMVMAVIETVGYFVSFEQGPYGIAHIRRRASEATGIPVDRLIVTSNHSHSSVDTVGIWGPQPKASYLELVDDRTVEAISASLQDLKAVNVRSGQVYAPELVSNDYAGIPGNETSDPYLRVLQAFEPDTGRAVQTLVNLSAHPILWIDSSKGHGDWPAAIGNAVAAEYGGEGIGVVGAIGRMAPDRSEAGDVCGGKCKLDYFVEQQMMPRVRQAITGSVVQTGDPLIESKSYLLLDDVVNPVPLALFMTPDVGQLSIARRDRTPWLTGNLLGTVAYSARIGSIALDGGPGEMFPTMPETVREIVPASMHFPVGLAGDMLGYIVHPTPEAYPEVLRRFMFNDESPEDPAGWEFTPIGDDKFVFNISPTFGERVVCAMLRGHGEIDEVGLQYWDQHVPCAAFGTDLIFASGDDTRQVEL